MKKTIVFSLEEAAALLEKENYIENFLPGIEKLNSIGASFEEILTALKKIRSLFTTGFAGSIPTEGVSLSEETLKDFEKSLKTINRHYLEILYLKNTMPCIIEELDKILHSCREI